MQLFGYACFVFIVSPPSLLLSGSPDDRCRCPCDLLRRRRPPLSSSFQASRSTSPLPHIAYLSIIICCTRHMLLLHYSPIQLHSLSLSPLDYLSDILCCLYIYNIYSSGPCALLVIG